MKPSMISGIVLFVLALTSTSAYGQFNPYAPRVPPDARTRRALRERAVAYAGPSSRAFVEAFGEDAVKAIFVCSPGGACRLAEFHASGGLATLPRPRDLLWVIAHPNHGDDVTVYAIANAPALADPDHFDVFLTTPLEYALGLKDLESDVRAHRLNANQRNQGIGLPDGFDQRWIAGGAGVLGALALLIWWKRRR